MAAATAQQQQALLAQLQAARAAATTAAPAAVAPVPAKRSNMARPKKRGLPVRGVRKGRDLGSPRPPPGAATPQAALPRMA